MQQYWDWADANKDKASPGTCAVYFFILRVANVLRWKDSFGLTSKEVMDGVNIGSYNTYRKYFDILVEGGLLKIDKPSTNQYNCNIIALSNFDRPLTNGSSNFDKALTTALSKNDEAMTTALSNFDKAHEKHVKHSEEYKDNKDNNKETVYTEQIKQVGRENEQFGTRLKAWFTRCTKEEFIEKVRPYKDKYPIDFLKAFVDFYCQEHAYGGIHVNHEVKFDVESRLRKWWADQDNRKKYEQTSGSGPRGVLER